MVASLLNKHHYNFWRPETAIRAGDTDSNRKIDLDPNFLPFIATPYRAIPQNTATESTGAAEILRRLCGEAGHSIALSNPAVSNTVLQYPSFKQIIGDISDVRVYGGYIFEPTRTQIDGNREPFGPGSCGYVAHLDEDESAAN